MSFLKQYRDLCNKNFSNFPNQTYRLGIDFGTSFTKIAYSFGNNNDTIKFGEKEYKQSIVYYDKKTKKLLFFRNNTETIMKIRYFKATMQKEKDLDGLKEYAFKYPEKPEIEDNFELLCSIFFLANIIKFATMYISDYAKVKASPLVSMGIPVSWNDEKNEIYNKALYGALVLYDEGNSEKIDITRIDIEELYDTYKKALCTFDNNEFDPKTSDWHMTMPEIISEINFFLTKKRIPEGLYCIVDVGGGTTDLAFLSKEKVVLINKLGFYCKYALVKRLGAEIKTKMNENEYLSRFSEAFGECLVKGKSNAGKKGIKITVSVYLLGGGTEYNKDYYKSILLKEKGNLEKSQIELKIEDIKEKNPRMIIAKQLALCDEKDVVKALLEVPLKEK